MRTNNYPEMNRKLEVHQEMMTSRSLLVVVAARRHWQSCCRQYSSFSKGQAAEESHAGTTLRTWKRVSLFVALPVVGYLAWKHLIASREHPEQREYFPWPHLRIRNKPFPWGDGDKTLFHNPSTNPGPGTETTEERKTLKSRVGDLWVAYLLEDPKERDKMRWEHLHQMQLRKEEYLAKRRMKEEPIQPMDFHTEVKATPVNPVDSGINN